MVLDLECTCTSVGFLLPSVHYYVFPSDLSVAVSLNVIFQISCDFSYETA